MSEQRATGSGKAWWARQVTGDLAVELWPGDSDHVQLVSGSSSVRVALADLETLRHALQAALEALDAAARSSG